MANFAPLLQLSIHSSYYLPGTGVDADIHLTEASQQRANQLGLKCQSGSGFMHIFYDTQRLPVPSNGAELVLFFSVRLRSSTLARVIALNTAQQHGLVGFSNFYSSQVEQLLPFTLMQKHASTHAPMATSAAISNAHWPNFTVAEQRRPPEILVALVCPDKAALKPDAVGAEPYRVRRYTVDLKPKHVYWQYLVNAEYFDEGVAVVAKKAAQGYDNTFVKLADIIDVAGIPRHVFLSLSPMAYRQQANHPFQLLGAGNKVLIKQLPAPNLQQLEQPLAVDLPTQVLTQLRGKINGASVVSIYVNY